MAQESVHAKLSRVRKPRVHITYQVQVGDAIEKREIPFVVGVLADLSGDRDNAKNPLPRVKDRKFVNIDRDDFDNVMGKIKPRLALNIKNTIEKTDTEIQTVLEFSKLADFSPERIVEQVPHLRALLDERNNLSNLRSSMYGNDKLGDLLKEVIDKTSPADDSSPDSASPSKNKKGK